MNTKHTPGPWHIGSGGVIFADHNDQPDAVTVANIPERLSTEMSHYANNAAAMSNARLIAAAPDLLNALGIAVATIQRLERHAPGSQNGTLDVARAAIAKATGE
jgi:hypothetical protein